MIAESGPWSLGTLIWLPTVVVLLLVLVLVVRWVNKDEREVTDGERKFFRSAIVAVATCLIVGTLVGMYPYKAEYHQWRQTEGVVVKIDKRLLASGSGMSERFVVTFAEGESRSCDDTRCSLVEVGDFLSLSCKRQWQYTGTDGYNCNYYSHTKEAS